MNSIQLVGRVVTDPTTKTTTTGKEIIEFRLVVRNPFKSQSDSDDFFNVRFFSPREGTSKFLKEFVAKGSGVWVSGSMRCNQYETKDGNKASWWFVDGREIGFNPSSEGQQTRPTSNTRQAEAVPVKEDDYDPFAEE